MNRILLTISSIFIFVVMARSQVLYIPQNGTITVTGGPQVTSQGGLHVSGDVLNEGDVLVTNLGAMSSSGNLENLGRFTIDQFSKGDIVGTLQNYGIYRIRSSSNSTIMGDFQNFGDSLKIESGAVFNVGGLTSNSLLSGIAVGINSTFTAQGDVVNDGLIDNVGTIALYQNWANNNYYSGTAGKFEFLGFGMQRIYSASLGIGSLTIDADDTVLLEVAPAGDIRVYNELDFNRGVLKARTVNQNEARFVVNYDADVLPGNSDSYFEGTLILEGNPDGIGDTEVKRFPVGSNGRYNPIEFQRIDADAPYELAVRLESPNKVSPVPDSSIIGISGESVWRVELLVGSADFDSTELYIDFMNEDLENFDVFNDIKSDRKGPIVAVADSAGGVYHSLGAGTYVEGDSLTYGKITSLQKLSFDTTVKYVAIGVAPLIPEAGVVFIPEVFSPSASDLRNRTFRVFGEKILNQDFSIVIINQYNNIMYQTNDFEEANDFGWDGKYKGGDAPAGVYYYRITLRREGQTQVEKYSKSFYLLR